MQSIEIQVEDEFAKNDFEEESNNYVSSTTEIIGTGVIRFHRRTSVIKSPCEFATLAKYFQDKLSNEISMTYKEYLETEQENITLNLQTEDLDRLVKQQDYEIACLKYDLEKIRQSKIALSAELSKETLNVANGQNCVRKVVQPEVEQVPSSTVSMDELAPAQLPQHHIFHKVDVEKQPEIYCVCGVKFTTKQNLREHIKYNTFRTNFNCNVCGIWKHGLNQLRTHMKVTHGISSAYLTSLKGCRLCGKLFTSLAQIHEHRRTQHSETRTRERKNGETRINSVLCRPTNSLDCDVIQLS